MAPDTGSKKTSPLSRRVCGTPSVAPAPWRRWAEAERCHGEAGLPNDTRMRSTFSIEQCSPRGDQLKQEIEIAYVACEDSEAVLMCLEEQDAVL